MDRNSLCAESPVFGDLEAFLTWVFAQWRRNQDGDTVAKVTASSPNIPHVSPASILLEWLNIPGKVAGEIYF